jgi:phosphoketolase
MISIGFPVVGAFTRHILPKNGAVTTTLVQEDVQTLDRYWRAANVANGRWAWTREHGEDLPEVANWVWGQGRTQP